MINGRGDDVRRAGLPHRPVGTGVLADRIAAALVHHEPGWRLPRLTALARRYQVSAAEVDAALDELAARRLLRRLPDGQAYRASPAEYQIPLEGVAGLASRVDPMGGQIARRSRQVSRRRPPEGVARWLRLAPGEEALAVRCLWTVGGEPGALSTSYLPGRLAGLAGEPAEPSLADGPLADALLADPLADAPADPLLADPPADPLRAEPEAFAAGRPSAVQIELCAPPPSVARILRMGPTEQVTTVTVCFEDPGAAEPAALTTVMLKPGLFRVVIEARPPAATGGGEFAAACADLAAEWAP